MEREWITVSEGLPDENARVLTTVYIRKTKRVRSGSYYRELFINDNGDTWEKDDKHILAWMPLPEPYKAMEDKPWKKETAKSALTLS